MLLNNRENIRIRRNNVPAVYVVLVDTIFKFGGVPTFEQAALGGPGIIYFAVIVGWIQKRAGPRV